MHKCRPSVKYRDAAAATEHRIRFDEGGRQGRQASRPMEPVDAAPPPRISSAAAARATAGKAKLDTPRAGVGAHAKQTLAGQHLAGRLQCSLLVEHALSGWEWGGGSGSSRRSTCSSQTVCRLNSTWPTARGRSPPRPRLGADGPQLGQERRVLQQGAAIVVHLTVVSIS